MAEQLDRDLVAGGKLLAALLSLCWITAAQAATGEVDFNRDIRPILSANCYTCHGFDEHDRQADLRLDEAESAYADRDGVRAIVPGEASESEVWRRISSQDESEMMPPPDSHRTLSDDEKQKLRQWIDQGAEYAEHWSFVPPQKAELPAVARTDWVRSEIDRFVLARLESEGLGPAAEADRETLIRRLSLDLTGLPPSAEEVEQFIRDTEQGAYERLVERLLANPHFGERMALDWLDAARYADTNGYSIDGGRHMWLWRDWVIDAFNRNLPYDEFLRQQLAGDLADEPGEGELIATGFQRNNMVTHEGGTIPEENLANYNADRVKTLGEAVLGLTLGCAQCHDHKYDPITQREYYQLFAYFNTASDIGLDGNWGRNPRPSHESRTVLQADDTSQLGEQIESLRRQLADPDPEQIAAWEADERLSLQHRGRGLALEAVELLNVSTPNSGSGFGIEDNRARVTKPAELVAYDVSLRLPQSAEPISGIRVVFHADEVAPEGGLGFGHLPDAEQSEQGTFVLTAISASAERVPADQVNLHRLLPVRQATATSWHDAYRPADALDMRNQNGWSPADGAKAPQHVTLTFDEPIDPAERPFMTVQLNFGHGHNLVAANFEILAMTGIDDGSRLPADVIAILEKPSAQRDEAELERLRTYYAQHADATRPLRTALANHEERLATLTEKFPTMVMDVADEPRQTHVLVRGNYAQPGERVEPGTPAALPALPDDAPANRLGLARWVTMRSHPLTARVAVNRAWQSLFGTGIVGTAADFGAQGEWPSHPELLDWLAADFMDHGWDVKRLVRQIVHSATYRQDSSASAAILKRDPQNRLLARGPRFRLPAELIRDSALKVSGLLVPWLGGPSVNPYSPGDLWREVSHYPSTPATAQTFVQDHGEKLYRRSLYTYWKRTVPPPNLAAFDAPNRETCVVSRPVTTTPLQALVLLNDVQFVEASRAFAERIIHAADDDDARLRWAHRECLSRTASDEDIKVLARTLARERARYAADEQAARQYLANGESPRDQSISVAEHAAWSQVAALLLNLSETVTRN